MGTKQVQHGMAVRKPRSAIAAVLARLAETRQQEAALLAELAETLDDSNGGEWLSHVQWEAPPNGETEQERAARLRRWSDRARRGEIAGAVKQGKAWIIRRSDLDAHFASMVREPEKAADVASLVDLAVARAARRGRS